MYDYSDENALGRPIWEGLADCISHRFEYIAKEEVWRREGHGFQPEKSFLEQQTRSLGDVPSYINELLTGMLLNLWHHKGEGHFPKFAAYKASLAFLDACFGTGPETQAEAENGWLVKKIFTESGFDFEKAIVQIRSHSPKAVEELVMQIAPHPLQREFRERLIREYLEFAPLWQPFGKDSIT